MKRTMYVQTDKNNVVRDILEYEYSDYEPIEMELPLPLGIINAPEDPKDVIVDFADSRVTDHSAIEAIETLAERYNSQGKTLHLRHLSPDCRKLLDKAGSLVEINVKEDPSYKVATDILAG